VVRCGAVQCGAVQCGAVQCGAVRSSEPDRCPGREIAAVEVGVAAGGADTGRWPGRASSERNGREVTRTEGCRADG